MLKYLKKIHNWGNILWYMCLRYSVCIFTNHKNYNITKQIWNSQNSVSFLSLFLIQLYEFSELSTYLIWILIAHLYARLISHLYASESRKFPFAFREISTVPLTLNKSYNFEVYLDDVIIWQMRTWAFVV